MTTALLEVLKRLHRALGTIGVLCLMRTVTFPTYVTKFHDILALDIDSYVHAIFGLENQIGVLCER